MKNILLPTDFSENSRNAILYALEFFKGSACTFYFLNVQKSSDFIMDDVMMAAPGTSVYQGILKDNKQRLKEFMLPLKKQFQGEGYEFLSFVDFDVLTNSIKQLMDSENIDLIVMGTNGASGAKEVLFGSNTLHVIRKVDCPVLAIPEGYSFKNLESVLFTAHSFKEIEHKGVSPLKDMMDIYHPQLHILKLIEGKDPIREDLDARSIDLPKGIDCKLYTLRRIPTPIAVDSFVQLINVDLHAMFVERETFLERFLFGTSTAKISYGTRVPLLILHK